MTEFVPSGYISIREALNRLGRELFGSEWTGEEHSARTGLISKAEWLKMKDLPGTGASGGGMNFAQGMAVMTPGVAALGAEAVERIVKTIAVFDDFCHANDPYEEHDFGAFEANDHMIYFKIDYLDQSMSMHSPDPADPSVTQRVITIMLAEEY
jgi:hypothetical protein